MERKTSGGRALRLLYIALLLLGVYLLLRYAVGTLLPFVIGAGIALPISSLARFCKERLGGSQRAWRIFLLFVAWGVILVGLTLALARLAREAGELLELLEGHGEEIAEWIKNTFEAIVSLPAKLPILYKLSDGALGGVGDRLGEATAAMLEKILSGISTGLVNAIGKLALSTPRAIVGALVTVVSSFYICVDREKLLEFFIGLLGKGDTQRLESTLKRLVALLRAHARAYAYLFLITFVELYIGLLLLGRRSAFLVALLIALIDLLPLLGAGLVLLPWAVVLIANGSVASGVGMLALLAVVSAVRQIVEPRLIAKELGLHPFVSLAAMYIGFSAFGFFGMIVAPVAVSLAAEQRRSQNE